MKRLLLALSPLLLSGCADILFVSAVEVVGRAPDRIHAEYWHKANYANSDAASITGQGRERSWLGTGMVSFLCVDGQDVDQAGYPYWMFSTVFVAPGKRRLAVQFQTSFTRSAFSELEFEVAARHAYRINAEKVGDEIQLKLWDETDGPAKSALVADVRRFPVVHNVDALLRTHKSGSAVVIGDEPNRFNQLGEKSVYLKTLDGGDPNTAHLPSAPINRWYVAAGPHQLVVDAQGPYWWLESYRSPPVDIEVAAQHVYRVTVKETNHLVLLQFWDETAGMDGRKLLQEIPLGDVKS